MSVDTITEAFVDHVDASGVSAGRGVQPASVGWTSAPGQSAYVPFAVVWRIGSQDVRQWYLEGGFDEWRVMMFVRCFGASPVQADQTMQTVRDQVLTIPIVVPGFRTVRVWLDNSQTTTKSEDVEVPTFEAGDFYRLWMVPT